MFEKLRKGLSGLVDKIANTKLKGEKLDPILEDLKLTLLENDVALSVADRICEDLKGKLEGVEVGRFEDQRDIVKKALGESLLEILTTDVQVKLLNILEKNRNARKPAVFIFVGINGTGKCVKGNSLVPLSNGEVCTIKKIYEMAAKRGQELKINDGYLVLGPIPGIRILTVDPQTLRISHASPLAFWKLKSPKKLFRLTLKGGYSVTVTPEHPFFVLEEGTVKKVKAEALHKNCYVMLPKKLPEICVFPSFVPSFVTYSLELSSDLKFFIVSKEFYDFGFPLGGKSNTLHSPGFFQCQPNTPPKELLISYLDGDGAINGDKRTLEIVTASEDFGQILPYLSLRSGTPVSSGVKYMNGSVYHHYFIAGKGKFNMLLEELPFTINEKYERLQKAPSLHRFEEVELVPNIGGIIKELRERTKTPQKKLANFIGCTQDLISSYEHNRARVPTGKLKKIIEYFEKEAGSYPDLITNLLQKLRRLAYSEVFWSKITKIEIETTEDYVYDLTIPFYHNFIANNIVVHNTTSIAKVAKLLMENDYSVVLACSDTFRAGSIEQLGEHAKRLGVKMIKHRYGSDAAAVSYDAIKYAEAHGINAVLIDTAGRMQTDKNLMEEMKKIVRVANPDLIILVADALTGNDAVEQARVFNEAVGIDATILTKIDADAKGGAAISIAQITKKPVIYLGTGQGYSDLIPFDPGEFVKRVLD